MKITDVSIKRPMLVTVLVIIVLLLGGVSFSRLSIDLYPDMELPIALVMTNYSGAGPEEVEQQITKPMESVLSSVNNLDTISSTSSTGSSTIMIMLNWGADMDFASLDIREKVDIIRDALPDDASSPTIYKADLNMMPIVQVAAHSTDSMRLKQVMDDVIQPRLERVGGVASVWHVGGWEREIQVRVNPVKLNGYNLSLNTLTNALGSENMNFSAGALREGRDELLLRVTGEFENLDQVRRVVVGNFGGSPVYLGDVAEVTDGQKKETQISRVNGQPGLTLMINKQSGANTVAVAQGVKAELEKLQQELPDTSFEVIMDQSEYIEQSINNLFRSAIEGGILAIFIILIFLRNFRSTMIISTSIPIAIIGAFVLLYFNDMTLNMITLGGLALGIGLIVDDSIVVLENIYRHTGEGADRVTAAREATGEVGSAVIASSLTLVAVFLPIIFVEGLAAQLFTPMALSITFCILASLAVAVTLVPLLASRWLNVYQGNGEQPVDGERKRGWRRIYNVSERWFNKLEARYSALLQTALRRRKLTILLVTVTFVLSLFTIPLLGMEFMPGMDQGYVTINVDMAKGTALEETDRVAADIEGILETMPGIQSVSTSVGSGGSFLGGGDANQASISLKLVDQTQRDITSEELAGQLSAKLQSIPGADINVTAMESGMGGGGEAPVQVQISGDDLDTLARLGDQVAGIVRQVPGTREVVSSLEEGRPELHVVVNRDRASMYGLGLAEVASTVRTAVDGSVATRYRVGGEEVDIRVQLSSGDGEFTPALLSGLNITSMTGAQIPLNQVAELKQDQAPSSITRSNQARTVTITSQLAGRDLGSVVRDIEQGVADLDLPSGYLVDFGGEQEQMMESFGSLGLALILAVILVYLVMVAQFESLLYPFVIMFSVPVTLTGVLFALLLTGRSLSVVAFIGMIMLVGIVVKNGIVLVDYINILRQRGLERNEAILQAGPTRLRPILMTALTTVMAMFPMALGIGEGGEAQAPLATVVVGGLLFSTLITLVLVPVAYTLMDDFGAKLRSIIFRRKQT